MMRKILLTALIINSLFASSQSLTAESLIQKVREKLGKVKDYEANGKMKTNVVFLKVPVATVKVYYKTPDKLKIKNEKGISFIPKGAVSINMNNILTLNSFTAIDGGSVKLGNKNARIVKLLPVDENTDLVLSTLYIDEKDFVILKAKTTTRDNGTYELEMSYGKYAEYGLADKVIFTFNTKDYKMPKGVTFDFDDGSQKKNMEKMKDRKGKVEISYSSYIINKGLAAGIFD